MAKKSASRPTQTTHTKTPARVNPVTAEIETDDPAPEAPVNRGRGLCVVCKSRFAFNDDGTCNDKGCPSYTARMKRAAVDRQAEIAAGPSEELSTARAGFAVGDKVTLTNSATVLTIKHVNGKVALLSNGSKVSVGNLVKADPRMTTKPTPTPAAKSGLASKLGGKPLPAPSTTPPAQSSPAKSPPKAPAQPSVQPDRSVGFRWRSADGHYGVLHIAKDGDANDYLLSWVNGTVTRVTVQLTKLEEASETRYTVTVPRTEGGEDKCGCVGHDKHRHCKHVEAIRALVAAGKL